MKYQKYRGIFIIVLIIIITYLYFSINKQKEAFFQTITSIVSPDDSCVNKLTKNSCEYSGCEWDGSKCHKSCYSMTSTDCDSTRCELAGTGIYSYCNPKCDKGV